MKIAIDDRGQMTMIYSDKMRDLLDEGDSVTTRASNVEPGANGDWIADLRASGGPVLTGFRYRADALAAEVKWIEENILA